MPKLFVLEDSIKHIPIQLNLTFDFSFICLWSTSEVGFLSSLKNLHFHQRACWAVLDYHCAAAKGSLGLVQLVARTVQHASSRLGNKQEIEGSEFVNMVEENQATYRWI